MEDLLTIHIEKIENGMLSIPPSKWCVKKSRYSIVWKLKGISEHLFCINGTYSDGLKQTPNQQLYKENFGEYLALAEIAQEYKNFEPSSSQLEECHRAKYVYEHPDTQIEVATPAGSIDCLTKTEVVELKVATKWKDGLGQLLAYSVFYPEHKKVLILFGSVKPSLVEVIQKVCCDYSVEVRQC